MKAITMTMTALLMLGAVGSARAQDPVYPGMKPHWWDLPMRCSTDDDGAEVCGGGAWTIPRLKDRPGMDGQSFTCGNKVAMKKAGPWTVGHADYRSVQYATWVEHSGTTLEDCLKRPLTMRVGGRDYRLGTKLLRQGLENVRSR